jgi:alpha-aminoadipate/glutamate carrier protein LysW
MVNCPLCDAVIDVDEDELDEGDPITCDECGATLTVASTSPLELTPEDDKDDDEEDEFDEDYDEDEDEDFDEEDDEEEEEEWE